MPRPRFLVHERCGPLLELSEVLRALGGHIGSRRGVHPIPIASIIGTVDRCCDFDRCFHILRPELKQRADSLRASLQATQVVPTIDVFQVDQAYFVLDGHHRVAIARADGAEMIDADITQIVTLSRLSPAASLADIRLAAAERRFRVESQLDVSRPQANVRASKPETYADLLDLVKAFGYDQALASGTPIDAAEVAAAWYDREYVPLLHEAAAAGIPTKLRELGEAELFLVAFRARRTAFAT